MIYNIEDNEEIDILKENCQIVNYDILWDKQILLTLVNIHEPEIHLWDMKSKKMRTKKTRNEAFLMKYPKKC